jgi:hypothetical protein
MKKILLPLLFIMFCLPSFAQTKLKEAEFIGDVRALNADSSTSNLEKVVTKIKTKATGSKIWWGIGSSKAFIEVKGKTSSASFSKNTPIQFIIKSDNNNLDPLSIISVFQYEIKGGDRRAVFGKVNNLFGNSDSGLKLVGYNGKKFGSASYIIELSEKNPGEYGIIVRNPNLQNEDSSQIVYSFTIK